MRRLVSVCACLAIGAGSAAADPPRCSRVTAGAAVGHVEFPFGDDDSFSGTLLSGYAGGRPSCGFAAFLRVDRTADTVGDPFDSARDHDDRYVMAMPSLRFGSMLWFEIGVGVDYRWRHYHDGTDDDRAQFAFDLAVGVSPRPPGWRVKPELSIGLLARTGFFATIGLGY